MMLEVMGPSGFPIHLKGNAAGAGIFSLEGSGGYYAQVSKTRPANTTAYSDGDVVGATDAIWTFPNMGAAGKTTILTGFDLRIDIAGLPTGMDTFRWELYSSAPTAIADNAPFDLIAADRAIYLGYISVTKPVARTSTAYVQSAVGFSKPIRMAGTSLIALLVTDKGYTPLMSTVYTASFQGVPS